LICWETALYRKRLVLLTRHSGLQAELIRALGALVVFTAVARTLGPAIYAQVVVVSFAANLVFPILSLGWGQAVVRALAMRIETVERLTGQSLLVAFIGGGICVLGLTAIGGIWAPGVGAVALAALVTSETALFGACGLLSGVSQGAGRMDWYRDQVSVTVVARLASAVLLFVFPATLASWGIIQCTTGFIAVCACMFE
jgi:O-antigen/teichoic acid export membrane protein